MAQKVEVTITSDLSGEGGAHGVVLALDGTATEIDLTEAERAEVQGFLNPYFEKGRKTAVAKTGKRGPGRPRTADATPAVAGIGGSGLTKEQRAEVRAYAEANGHTLAKRGRLPELAISAWRQQNPEILSHLAA